MNDLKGLPIGAPLLLKVSITTFLVFVFCCRSLMGQPPTERLPETAQKSIRAVLATPDQVTEDSLKSWRAKQLEVVVWVQKVDRAASEAVQRVGKQLGSVDYFFEVARCPELAQQHPEWMASIQGHHEWMRLFEGLKKPKKDEVVKVYPWVPVFNREPFHAQAARIALMLEKLPKPKRVWLNDIQGAPSACGCGHPLCRWTADYGPLKTATPIGNAAPAEFIAKIQSIVGDVEIIPVMTSECEAADQHTVCGGVGCFEGACWKAFTQQLDLVASKTRRVGVACFYKEFDRDLKRYGPKAGWIRTAMLSFEAMPKIRDGKGLKPDRLVAVIQGWNVSPEELAQQQKIVDGLNPAGILICLPKIDQSWEPRLVRFNK